MHSLFQAAYYIGKEIIPFKKILGLCSLFVKAKTNMTKIFYHGERSCGKILFCILSAVQKKVLDKIWESKFFGIMIDEFMDIFVTSHFVVFASFIKKISCFLHFSWIVTYWRGKERCIYNIWNINKKFEIMGTKFWQVCGIWLR